MKLIESTEDAEVSCVLVTVRFTLQDLQSLPLMKSEHQCTQEVSSRILRSSTCDETHTFRPFSSQSGGARTTVTQRLTFKTEKRGVTTRSGETSSFSCFHSLGRVALWSVF